MAHWVRVDCDLFDHPKYWLLRRALGDDAQTTHTLLRMWTWFSRLEPEGTIRGVARCREFAAWLHHQSSFDHEMSEDDLVRAIVEAEFLDGTPSEDGGWERLSVVDWEEYNGDFYDKRNRQKEVSRASSKRHREKLRYAQERSSETGENVTRDEVRDVVETSRVTYPNVTQRHAASRSEYDSRHATSPSRDTIRYDTLKPLNPLYPPKLKAREVELDFATWWAEYGKVGSRADALKLYCWWREQGATREDLLLAAQNYRAHCVATDCTMKHGRTFLAKDPCRWKEWADGEEHGTMNPREQQRLKGVLDTAVEWLGGERGQLGDGAHTEGGGVPRLGLPESGVEGSK